MCVGPTSHSQLNGNLQSVNNSSRLCWNSQQQSIPNELAVIGNKHRRELTDSLTLRARVLFSLSLLFFSFLFCNRPLSGDLSFPDARDGTAGTLVSSNHRAHHRTQGSGNRFRMQPKPAARGRGAVIVGPATQKGPDLWFVPGEPRVLAHTNPFSLRR